MIYYINNEPGLKLIYQRSKSIFITDKDSKLPDVR